MAASREDIRGWLEEAKATGATHLIVVCDTYDWSDYPISVMPGSEARKVFEEHRDKPMQKVMEVYNLALDLDAQLNERRAFNF